MVLLQNPTPRGKAVEPRTCGQGSGRRLTAVGRLLKWRGSGAAPRR